MVHIQAAIEDCSHRLYRFIQAGINECLTKVPVKILGLEVKRKLEPPRVNKGVL